MQAVNTAALIQDDEPYGQLARIADLFLSPSRLFRSINQNKSWWLPFVLTLACNLALTCSAAYRVGIYQLSTNVLRSDPASADRLDDMTQQQQEAALNATETTFRISAFSTPILILLFNVIYALALWIGISFVGGRTQFASLFTVLLYADLVQDVRSILGTIWVFVTPDPELFSLQSPIGSNVGYYLHQGVPGWLRVLGESTDLFTLWYLFIIAIGCSIVAKTRHSSTFSVVFGLWLLVVASRVMWASI